MKERPILFSAPMVRALLAGTKTVTRRLVKPQPEYSEEWKCWQWPSNLCETMVEIRDMGGLGPYGWRGDRLWVKERFSWMSKDRQTAWRDAKVAAGEGAELVFFADEDEHDHKCWKPSIFMSRAQSRITLEVVSVRVERLHDITEEDAQREGVDRQFVVDLATFMQPGKKEGFFKKLDDNSSYLNGFRSMWREINGQESWDANPWVWRVEFKRVEQAARAA